MSSRPNYSSSFYDSGCGNKTISAFYFGWSFEWAPVRRLSLLWNCTYIALDEFIQYYRGMWHFSVESESIQRLRFWISCGEGRKNLTQTHREGLKQAKNTLRNYGHLLFCTMLHFTDLLLYLLFTKKKTIKYCNNLLCWL